MRIWCLLTTCRCYLGGAGIAEAFRQGANIVICGRVADAAPTIGAAIYHHGWDKDKDFDQVAGALSCWSSDRMLVIRCWRILLWLQGIVRWVRECGVSNRRNFCGRKLCTHQRGRNRWRNFSRNAYLTTRVRDPRPSVLWIRCRCIARRCQYDSGG